MQTFASPIAQPPEANSTPADTRAPWPPLARFRFQLQALDPLTIPAYPGSAWRGLLGHGLRQTACVTRAPVCDGCLLRSGCVYSTLFESPTLGPAAETDGGRYARLPHPFVLDLDLPPTPEGQIGAGHCVAPGRTTALGLTLIGPAVAQMPYLIHALGLAGRRGLGREGGRFRVAGLEREWTTGQGDWRSVHDPDGGSYQAQAPALPAPPAQVPQALRIRLRTPLRLKRQGRFVGAREFVPADLLRHLTARVDLLSRHYGGLPERFDRPNLVPAVQDLDIGEARLHWHDWTRYSSRQDTLMQLGGLLGDFELRGPGLASLWPLLWYGQWVHVGKGTSFGLGAYGLEPI